MGSKEVVRCTLSRQSSMKILIQVETGVLPTEWNLDYILEWYSSVKYFFAPRSCNETANHVLKPENIKMQIMSQNLYMKTFQIKLNSFLEYSSQIELIGETFFAISEALGVLKTQLTLPLDQA